MYPNGLPVPILPPPGTELPYRVRPSTRYLFGPGICLAWYIIHSVDVLGRASENLPPDFAEFVMDIHGMDVNSPPPLPTLVYDSRS